MVVLMNDMNDGLQCCCIRIKHQASSIKHQQKDSRLKLLALRSQTWWRRCPPKKQFQFAMELRIECQDQFQIVCPSTSVVNNHSRKWKAATLKTIATGSDYEDLSLPNEIENALQVLSPMSGLHQGVELRYTTGCSQWNDGTCGWMPLYQLLEHVMFVLIDKRL